MVIIMVLLMNLYLIILKKGTNVIGVLDIKGVLNVEKIYPEAISIFIMPPSF